MVVADSVTTVIGMAEHKCCRSIPTTTSEAMPTEPMPGPACLQRAQRRANQLPRWLGMRVWDIRPGTEAIGAALSGVCR